LRFSQISPNKTNDVLLFQPLRHGGILQLSSEMFCN